MSENLSGIKISAADCDDLAVLSACVQDAIAQVGDMAYVPERQRFAMLLSRFRWERPERGLLGGERHQRILAGLHLEHVKAVAFRGFTLKERDRVLELLAVTCGDLAEGGMRVEFIFAGDAAVRVDVARLAVFLADRSEGWTAPKPRHALGDDPGGAKP